MIVEITTQSNILYAFRLISFVFFLFLFLLLLLHCSLRSVVNGVMVLIIAQMFLCSSFDFSSSPYWSSPEASSRLKIFRELDLNW